MMPLAKEINQLYPDVLEAGGLEEALQTALRESHSRHKAVRRHVNIGIVCVRVETERRRCQAYIAEQQRLFVFDLWADDHILVGATSESLRDVARRVDR